MSSENKYSLKNLLFTRAIPSYNIPWPTDGHKVHSCLDCGDKFILESSYKYHINRKVVQITYTCRTCNLVYIFKNRCRLLEHIRSHVFKTATINFIDLKIKPLPIEEFKTSSVSQSLTLQDKSSGKQQLKCHECHEVIIGDGAAQRDLAYHYMQYKSGIYTCPVCMYVLPNACALAAHLRIHLKMRPFICPECGVHLLQKALFYPYSHDCEGFRVIRVTTRIQCAVLGCQPFHPNNYQSHMKDNHLKIVFKCPNCYIACFTKQAINKHIEQNHSKDNNCIALIFYQCQQCPGRLVLHDQVSSHLKSHFKEIFVYPCWTCGRIFYDVCNLINHSKIKCTSNSISKSQNIQSIQDNWDNCPKKIGTNVLLKVVKQCDKCKCSVTYKSKYKDIDKLPKNCPYNCTPSQVTNVKSIILRDPQDVNKIKCPLCKVSIIEEWPEIKKHFGITHKNHRCLDISIKLENKKPNLYKVRKLGKKENRVKVRKNQTKITNPKCEQKVNIQCKFIINDLPQLQNDEFACVRCDNKYKEKKLLEEHMVSHRDPYAAYQCLECSLCFIVKRSFSTHLLIKHNISDVDDYIKKHKCYNEEALDKCPITTNVKDIPVKENQCKICYEEFGNSEDLAKHFRVHGMAFLMDKKKQQT